VRRYVVLRSRVLLATPTARPASGARDAAPPSPEGFTWDVHPNAINTKTACPDLHANRTSCRHRATAAFDPERTSGLGVSQILAGHSFANEQPAKAKKPRKVAAGQEMLLPISGKRTTKQVVKKANKRAAARSRKWA
jgi:hypothetical protein